MQIFIFFLIGCFGLFGIAGGSSIRIAENLRMRIYLEAGNAGDAAERAWICPSTGMLEKG